MQKKVTGRGRGYQLGCVQRIEVIEVGEGGSGQGGCERRIEAFVKIQEKKMGGVVSG